MRVLHSGHRATIITGASLASAGLLSAGLYTEYCEQEPPNILVLYLTIILTGLGHGVMYLPSLTIIKLYFDTKLGLAMGLAASGTGFGEFIWAPIVGLVNKNFPLATNFYFFAGINFASLLFCFIYKSPAEKQKTDETKARGDCLGSFRSILTTPHKLLFILHALLVNIGIFAVLTFFAARAISFGISETNTSYLLSMMGLASFICRIVFGVIADRFRDKVLWILFSVHFINGINIIISQFFKTFLAQALVAIIYGAAFGAKVTLNVVLIRKPVVTSNSKHGTEMEFSIIFFKNCPNETFYSLTMTLRVLIVISRRTSTIFSVQIFSVSGPRL